MPKLILLSLSANPPEESCTSCKTHRGNSVLNISAGSQLGVVINKVDNDNLACVYELLKNKYLDVF